MANAFAQQQAASGGRPILPQGIPATASGKTILWQQAQVPNPGVYGPTGVNALNGVSAANNSVLSASTKAPVKTSTLSGGNGNPPAVNQGTQSPFPGAEDAARAANDALLSSLNTEYDRSAAQAQNDLSNLGQQKDNSLGELNTAFTGTENQVKNAKTASDTGTNDAIKSAGSVAQSTQLQNRNILRALGILNSTAGGDLLSKPMNEFDKQRVSLVSAHLQRINELDDTLNQAAAQHSDAVKSLETTYAGLVDKIQTDLRFNDRQRADAIRSANAALQQHLSDIQTSLFNYKTQVDAAKAAAGQAITSIASYAQPTANLPKISSTLANPGQAPTSSNAQIYGTDPNQKKLTGGSVSDYSLNQQSPLLSGLA